MKIYDKEYNFRIIERISGGETRLMNGNKEVLRTGTFESAVIIKEKLVNALRVKPSFEITLAPRLILGESISLTVTEVHLNGILIRSTPKPDRFLKQLKKGLGLT